jgi:ABC-2 type transport system ATP-binding protein
MTGSAIQVADLTKHFGRVRALEGLTLDVARGEIFGFLGANGAGKTTTIRLLLDLLRPTRGRASLLGLDCHRNGLAARALVGYLPGELPLYPDITARQLIAFLAKLASEPPDRAWIATLQHRFSLDDAALERRMVHLSHGMKQKVGLVQALMGRPPVVILDEPTAGLDPLMIEAFCETVTELRAAGHTIFLSSHVLAEVERLCDRIALVESGRLVRVASIDDIRREFPRRVHVTLASDAPPPPPLPGVTLLHAAGREWTVQVKGELGPLLDAARPHGIADLAIENFRLEDFILGLYERQP